MMELAEGQMTGTLGREVISTRQRKIAELARREPKLTLTTLAHHIDAEWMREAYRRVRKDAAVGVDGVTAAHYEAALEANLSGLLERFKSGAVPSAGGAPGAPGEAGHEQDAPDWHPDAGGRAARLAAVLAGESPVGVILSLTP